MHSASAAGEEGMAEVVYILCAVTSIVCAALLSIRFARTHMRLLLWTSLCFAGLALNNILLFVDVVVVPAYDLSILRSAIALAAVVLLLVGLIWERR
jgi:hypothetical protein